VIGYPGKPDRMTGAEVEKFYRDGHIREIAEYCDSDVHTGYGSATNSFAGDCQMLSFREARPTLWSSLRRGAPQSRIYRCDTLRTAPFPVAGWSHGCEGHPPRTQAVGSEHKAIQASERTYGNPLRFLPFGILTNRVCSRKKPALRVHPRVGSGFTENDRSDRA